MNALAKTVILSACIAVGSSLHAGEVRQVNRITHQAADGRPALILKGVIVPAGYDTLYLSGQVADPIQGENFGDTKVQTLNILKKIERLLEGVGYGMGDVIKMQAYLAADPKIGKIDYAGFNAAFAEYFTSVRNPNTIARSTFQVANLVQPAFLVELEVTAVKAPALGAPAR